MSSGWLHRKISSYIERQQRQVDGSEIKVVGRNLYQAAKSRRPDIKLHNYDESVDQLMREKLAALRKCRDSAQVDRCLEALKKSLKKEQNIMTACVACARANVTKGEMRRAFTEALGRWRSPIYS